VIEIDLNHFLVIENGSSILVRIGIVQEKFQVMENEENAYLNDRNCSKALVGDRK
jgi:hypothetical protein